MKKILILGAGIYQVPLIDTARRMGLYTIVASIPGNYPGFSHADEVAYINTTDVESVLKFAREKEIDAITTCGTDVAVATIGTVCEAMGLAGVSRSAALLCTDKAKMKKALWDAGVRTSEFVSVMSEEEACKAAERLGWPVMFKCPDSSGSRGVIRVNDVQEIPEAFRYAMQASRGGHILVERFVSGHEIGLDGVVQGDKIVLWPHDKLTRSNGLTDVPIGHVVPLELGPEEMRDIRQQACTAVRALGIDQSFFNMDIMLCEGKAYIIEIGARIGATCIPEVIGAAGGFDCYEEIVRCALGQKLELTDEVSSVAAAQLLCSDRNGVLESVDAGNVPEDARWTLDVKPGEQVRRFRVGPDRIGQVVVVDGDRAAALRKLKKAVESIHLNYTAETI
ncbi:ATP-binding protein [Allofournierella sp. CML151]|uniref:ATP-binding protein n=1 Tax=Allofournierella sp. CML151 TaxID=2998082 RepID=UPI0022EA870E|nr:ATP-grasp domain-containing protein [Fournierella sp. CML151]